MTSFLVSFTIYWFPSQMKSEPMNPGLRLGGAARLARMKGVRVDIQQALMYS